MPAAKRTRGESSESSAPNGIVSPESGPSEMDRRAWTRISASGSFSRGRMVLAAASRRPFFGKLPKSPEGDGTEPRRAMIPRPQRPWMRSIWFSDSVAFLKTAMASALRVNATWARRRTRESGWERNFASSADSRLSKPSEMSFAACVVSSGR